MRKIRLGGALEVSAVGLGCMRMEDMEAADVRKVIETSCEAGITFFDHADCYGFGKSESVFSEAMEAAGIKREDVVLQSKCGIRK